METAQGQTLDLAELARTLHATAAIGPGWSLVTTDLNLNVVRFTTGDGVEEHINPEVDVLGVVLAGAGVLTLDGHNEELRAGQLFMIPKGVSRSIRVTGDELVYLTCHRRRAGLMPGRRAHP